jgi:preprotein translocase subunit SecE
MEEATEYVGQVILFAMVLSGVLLVFDWIGRGLGRWWKARRR